MKHKQLFALFLLLSSFTFAQEATSEDISINPYIDGTLLHPSNNPAASPLVIMIQGSGPTDRNGNQAFMKNDSFKKLAQELAQNGIASFRFDKRIFKMQTMGITEEEIRFDDFVTDATSAIEYFKENHDYDKIVILGHSQGSLVGMLAAKDRADGFISIAGAGRSIDSIIIEQIEQQAPGLKENAETAFKEMRETGSTRTYNPVLESIFKPSLQPFMLSWMKFDPAEEIEELDMPVLVINGTKDLQVKEKDARELADSNPNAELVLLEDMNHVFRKIETDDLENSKSYNEPRRPLHPELVSTIVEFIKGIE